jgi:flagellar biosynthesis/type III secretory pathway protein FliH
MMSAVIQDNEESVGPLADGEVARLLSVLHNAEFTRSEKHDLAKNSKFRQRSLIEIAAEAEKRKDAIETDQQNSDSDIDRDSTKVENFSDAQPDSLSKKNLESVKTNESASEQTIRDITSKEKIDDEAPEPEGGVRGLTTNSTSISETDGTEPGIRGLTTNSTSISGTDETEQGIRGLTTNSTSISETDGTEPGIRGLTSVPHGEIDGSEKVQAPRELTSSSSGLDEEPAKNSFETVNEAFERGKTEGISEGRLAAIAETKERAIADAKAELADIVDTFNNVLDSLARPKAMQVEALSSSINTTILKLASERAGIQIDELPEAFSDRINALGTGIAQELAEGKVHLNKDDYAAMKPYLANLGFEVVVNSNLMRGDVTLQFDGVEVHDVAANRMASYSAVKSDKATADNTATAATADNTIADDNTATAATAATADDTTADDNAGLANMLKGDELLPPSDEPDS